MVDLPPVRITGDAATAASRFDNPAFLFGDAIAEAAMWGQIGPYAIVRPVNIVGDAVAAMARMGVTVPLAAAVIADAAIGVMVTDPAAPAVLAEITVTGDAAIEAIVRAVTNRLSAAIVHDAVIMADFIPPIPTVRAATLGELPGTVNLLRNPSLRFGTEDWQAVAPLVGFWSSSLGWDDTLSFGVAVPIGSGDPEILVRSYPALGIAGGSPWVGSAHYSCQQVVELRPFLRFHYTDSTSGADVDGADPVIIDPPELTWQRYETAVARSDPAKTIARVDLVTTVHQSGQEQAVFVDGAQVEEAPTGMTTPYADGDQGDGHRWHGAPHLSVSVREPLPREGGY